MKIPRPTQDDRDYFQSLLPAAPDIQVKPMFGNVGAFVNGNMFCGLFGSDIGIRLTDPDDRDELAAAGGGPFGPAERPMGSYLTLRPTWRDDPGHLIAARWGCPGLRAGQEPATQARQDQGLIDCPKWRGPGWS